MLLPPKTEVSTVVKKRIPTHPGILLNEDYIKPLNLNLQKLADRLSIARSTLFKIRMGKARVTPAIALSLAEAFDTTPQLWLNLQINYEEGTEMASAIEIKKHLNIALKEIGRIKPWFDKNFNAWMFSHKNYPDVEYAGDSAEDVIKNYPLYLRDFIKERLKDNLAPHIEKATKGHGGKRA